MAVSENSLKNLIAPKKGEVRNPNGKPKGTKHSATIIKKWLNAKEDTINPITRKKAKLSQMDIIVLQQLKNARSGDTTAFNALLDRMEGKPKQRQELSGIDGEPIETRSNAEVDYNQLPDEVLEAIVKARKPSNE